LLILIIGIGISVYLSQKTLVFSPKAYTASASQIITNWVDKDKVAPPFGAFEYRGNSTFEFGAQYSAPGIPASLQPKSSIIRYRDRRDSNYNYDLYITPAGIIWKIVRHDSSGSLVQYVGGHNYAECGDGNVTASDRVIMPAIGLNLNNSVEGGIPMTLRTNYGCMNNHFSNPWPVNNYQAAASGRGILPEITENLVWDHTTSTLTVKTIPKPWMYYEGILDKTSPQFQGDFAKNYGNLDLILQEMNNSLDNISFNYQIRILPDGTIMLTHFWKVLKDRPWLANSTDGYWITFDGAPGGTVYYFDQTTGQFINPFAGGANSNGLSLEAPALEKTGGWIGYFFDRIKSNMGIGFYTGNIDLPGGVGFFPSTNSPSVFHTDYFQNGLTSGEGLFRQNFLVIGTKEDMQSRSTLLNNYVKYATVPAQSYDTCTSRGGTCLDRLNKDQDSNTCSGGIHQGQLDCPEVRPYCYKDVSCLATSSLPSHSPTTGDIDGNGKIDIFDYNILLTNFGKTGTNIPGDLDKNGKVDIFDFNIVLTNFGK